VFPGDPLLGEDAVAEQRSKDSRPATEAIV
jgi:hypothetical protein